MLSVRLTLSLALCVAALAQQPAQQPPQRRPGGGGGGRQAPVADDTKGYEAIFDGKTLTNWDGDPSFWRVEDGAIVGQTTPENVLKVNTFIIWRGGVTKDFEFRAEYRITESGNSGVQYRSTALPEVHKWSLKGYQADIDGRNMYTGMLYEERARGFLAERGQFVRMTEDKQRKMIGTPGDGADLKALIKVGDWNQIHIIARGNVIMHVINGRLMSAFIDEDPAGRAAEGILGLQLHVGQPMKIEYRNVMLRRL